VWEIEIEFTTYIRKSLVLSMTILLGLALPIFADPPGYSGYSHLTVVPWLVKVFMPRVGRRL
jgi:hypothetical protein